MTLRGWIATAFCVVAAGSLIATQEDARVWPTALVLLVLAACAVFGNQRYQRLAAAAPPPPWQRTGERFVDPGSGRLVEVWTQPHTGERRYVDAGAGPRATA